ncbi:MAG: BrnT family toxin [Rhodospirillales bacterium]
MFEWDERKRWANLTKHGFDFRDVPKMWQGRLLIGPARRVGEEQRWKAIGIINVRIVAAIFVRRGGAIRVISARRARDDEKEAFIHHASDSGASSQDEKPH